MLHDHLLQQKIVVKLIMEDAKKRSKAMGIAVGLAGTIHSVAASLRLVENQYEVLIDDDV